MTPPTPEENKLRELRDAAERDMDAAQVKGKGRTRHSDGRQPRI